MIRKRILRDPTERERQSRIAAIRADIEGMVGGKVSIAPEVIVGAGKTRATLHGGELKLVSVTVRGDQVLALERLREMVAAARSGSTQDSTR